MNKSNFCDNTIFQKGEKIKNSNFTGTVWLETLVDPEKVFNCPIWNVTFEPGARNNWHKHPGGQILLITGGIGYYQEKGKTVQILQEGDIVRIHPDIKHWHGATPDNWFSHIAISTNVHKGEAEWLEPVTEEEYQNLK